MQIHLNNLTNFILTNWFDGEVSVVGPSVPNIIKGFEEVALCITSPPGVWVDGVEGAELGDGPAVFAVPELFAGPEDDTGCFLFLPFWYALETLISIKLCNISTSKHLLNVTF